MVHSLAVHWYHLARVYGPLGLFGPIAAAELIIAGLPASFLAWLNHREWKRFDRRMARRWAASKAGK